MNSNEKKTRYTACPGLLELIGADAAEGPPPRFTIGQTVCLKGDETELPPLYHRQPGLRQSGKVWRREWTTGTVRLLTGGFWPRGYLYRIQWSEQVGEQLLRWESWRSEADLESAEAPIP